MKKMVAIILSSLALLLSICAGCTREITEPASTPVASVSNSYGEQGYRALLAELSEKYTPDMILPDLNGFDLSSALFYRRHPVRETPIIDGWDDGYGITDLKHVNLPYLYSSKIICSYYGEEERQPISHILPEEDTEYSGIWLKTNIVDGIQGDGGIYAEGAYVSRFSCSFSIDYCFYSMEIFSVIPPETASDIDTVQVTKDTEEIFLEIARNIIDKGVVK